MVKRSFIATLVAVSPFMRWRKGSSQATLPTVTLMNR